MDCVMFGITGDYLRDTEETVFRLGWTVRAYVTNTADAVPDVDGPILDIGDVGPDLTGFPAVVPIATPAYRRQAVNAACQAGFSEFPPVVDPTAVLARNVVVERGAMVNASSVLAPGVRLGEFSVLNRGCSIGHDSVVERYGCVGPSTALAGRVTFGADAQSGVGAVVKPGVRIGTGSELAAGAVVLRDVADGATVVGNPATTLLSHARRERNRS